MPRIYVASLADYNAGVLHGAWIDATDADTIQDEVNAMLRASKHPNVMVSCPDCDGTSAVAEGLTDAFDAPDGEPIYACDTCHDNGEVPSAEEWAIHDYEGFAGIKLSEWEPFETVANLAALIEEHGEAIALFYNNDTSRDIDSLADDFQEAYRGQHDTLEAYAADYIEQTGMLDNVNETIKNYFDYESFARDLKLGGDVWTERDSDGNLHVFDNNV